MTRSIAETFAAAMREHRGGRLGAARTLYLEVLARKPDHAAALQHLGLIAHANGRHDEAIELMRRGIAAGADSAEGFYNLGVAHSGKGDVDQAITAYRRAIAINPNLAAAQNNLGNALRAKKQWDEAIAALRIAETLEPGNAETRNNLGVAVQEAAQAFTEMGSALAGVDRLDEAAAAYGRAAELRPESAEALSNLGVTLSHLGRIDEAIRLYRRAIALSAECAEAHHNLALALLLFGQYEEGWREFEWRWRWNGFSSPRRNFAQPSWNGEPLAGRTLLVHAEQGLGDTIQFVRYVRLLADRHERIVFECAPELVRLMPHVTGLETVQIAARGGIDDAGLPAFDVHAPLMSLPLLMELPRPEDVGGEPYLHVDVANEPAQRLGGAGFKVGLAWAGSPLHRGDRRRSLPARALAPLLRSDAQFYSLQVGEAAKQTGGLPGLVDLSPQIGDFLDTARLVSQMDLVISVDTAVAHLAGAMGKRTFMLLPAIAEFRWMLEREDSSWYRSLRLFRQRRLGEWDEVVAHAAGALQREISQCTGGGQTGWPG